MRAMASQITSLTIVYSTVYSGTDERKHQSSASLAFVRGIDRWPVNSPHKGPVTRKMFPFDDVIMNARNLFYNSQKRKGRQGEYPGRHWGRWSLSSMSPVTIRAVILTFPFHWLLMIMTSMINHPYTLLGSSFIQQHQAEPIMTCCPQWNLNLITNFIQENDFSHVVCNMAAILFRPWCVQSTLGCCNVFFSKPKIDLAW